MSIASSITICSTDGFPLSATLYCPPNLPAVSRAAVINAGAGIPARYYGRFADWLADRGVPTLIYDYRGIGGSCPVSLRGFKASVEEWGSKDCAAAMSFLVYKFPGADISVIGHSIGCFVTGFVSNPPKIEKLVFVGAHTGYYGDYASSSRPAMRVLWHSLMPAVTRIFGYFPGRSFGLPADLPYGIAMEWAGRRHPNFWWNIRGQDGNPDTEKRDELLKRFSAFESHALALRTTDDPFGTGSAANRMESLFRSVRFHHYVVDVKGLSLPHVGHFGYFRSRSRTNVWPIIGDWLQTEEFSATAYPSHG